MASRAHKPPQGASRFNDARTDLCDKCGQSVRITLVITDAFGDHRFCSRCWRDEKDAA